MTIFVIIIHVFVCLALIMIVLLQTGKGADMGAAFGGTGSQALFGSTGGATFLSKATTVVAVIFMVTCFYLAYQSTQKNASTILKDAPAPVAPIAAPVTENMPTTDVTTENAAEKAADAAKDVTNTTESTPESAAKSVPEADPAKTE